MFIWDTDTFSEYLREQGRSGDAPITLRLSQVTREEVALTVVTISEVMAGMLNLLGRMEKVEKQEAGFAALRHAFDALQDFPLLDYDAAAHAVFGGFSAEVRRVGRADCQIAAIALARGYTVVTANTRHFARIPGVVFADWTRPAFGATDNKNPSDKG